MEKSSFLNQLVNLPVRAWTNLARRAPCRAHFNKVEFQTVSNSMLPHRQGDGARIAFSDIVMSPQSVQRQ